MLLRTSDKLMVIDLESSVVQCRVQWDTNAILSPISIFGTVSDTLKVLLKGWCTAGGAWRKWHFAWRIPCIDLTVESFHCKINACHPPLSHITKTKSMTSTHNFLQSYFQPEATSYVHNTIIYSNCSWIIVGIDSLPYFSYTWKYM